MTPSEGAVAVDTSGRGPQAEVWSWPAFIPNETPRCEPQSHMEAMYEFAVEFSLIQAAIDC